METPKSPSAAGRKRRPLIAPKMQIIRKMAKKYFTTKSNSETAKKEKLHGGKTSELISLRASLSHVDKLQEEGVTRSGDVTPSGPNDRKPFA